ncbi:MAG: DUF1343 domain-containing protein [Acidobacteriales bacterium]|nr:DUF1343 domain-containing protein [Terriglobales bacterium]
MNLRPALGIVAASLLLAPAFPQAARPKTPAHHFENVDAVIEQAIAQDHIPGAVLLVGHKGRVVYRKAYGMRALEPAAEPMTLDTIFDVASMTKSIVTAPAVMQLLGEGKLRLYDPIAKYIPEFGKNGKGEITIRQLLTHYSGLRPDLDLKDPWQGKEAAFQLIVDEKPASPPGTGFVYSDINYAALGFLVEKLSGMRLEDYAARRTLAPLHMTHTRFLPPKAWSPKIAPTEKDEHGVFLRGVVHDPTARRMGGVAGHAGLFSTADDLAIFAQALLSKRGILTPELIEKMTTPQQPPWSTAVRGFGWDIDTQWSSNRGELLPVGSFGHTGFTGTSIWIDPSSQTYILLLTNAVHTGGDSWGKVALRTKVSNAVATVLALRTDEASAARGYTITGYNEAAASMKRPLARNGKVLNGIDVLVAEGFAGLRGKRDVTRVGVLTNQTGLDRQGRRTIDLLASAPGMRLAAIFSPEHGATGQSDTTEIGDETDTATGVRVYSMYGTSDAARRPKQEIMKDLDVVVVDLQDIGARFYTYLSSVGYLLESAAKTGAEVVILDRPNPVTGVWVQGPVSDAPPSFVNYHALPARHGMTMGELATLFNQERGTGAKLTVVKMQGWQRGDWFDSTGQMWVNPSPNIRSLTAATLYTGVALIEQTNVSVGRGTDRPFELVGAPWIDPAKARELAEYLNARQISGVRFVPVQFTPTASQYAGQSCGGVNLIVTDRNQLDAPEMGFDLAAALVHMFPGDYKVDGAQALIANRELFESLRDGNDPRRMADQWQEDLEIFLRVRRKYLLYP